MARSDSTQILSRAFALWCGVVAVATLYFAKEILLPLALAILLSFLLAPLAKRLEKWGLKRVPAVVVTVVFAFGLLGVISYVLVMQVYDLANRLPEYQGNIIAKIQVFQRAEEKLAHRVGETIEGVRRKMAHQKSSAAAAPAGEAPAKEAADLPPVDSTGEPRLGTLPADANTAVRPLPVEIVRDFSIERIVQNILGPVISPLGTAALVVVFAVFMLIERETLRNRLIHLMWSGQLNVATQALDDATSRVSRYLLSQLMVNAVIGCVVALGLLLIGVPNAPMWGLLATVLRFVPYVGPWIAAALPTLLAAAVFQGWLRPTLVLTLFITIELVANNLVEPLLYGSSTGISTMGIMLSSVFWLWLWGPVGLVIATPLTVCLVVLGHYIPQLSLLNTLLGNEEVLLPSSRFYQRLLAMDPEEATDIAEDYLKDHSLESLYDHVLLPALGLAEQDRHQGSLDEPRERFILKATRELVDELGSQIQQPAAEKINGHHDAGVLSGRRPVICLPARDEADEIVGAMLAQLLERAGVSVVLASVQSLSGEMMEQVSAEESSVVCVSALPPLAATHARYLCKRLRPKFPHRKIVVGLWDSAENTKKAHSRLMETGIDRVVTTLADATSYLKDAAGSPGLLLETASVSVN